MLCAAKYHQPLLLRPHRAQPLHPTSAISSRGGRTSNCNPRTTIYKVNSPQFLFASDVSAPAQCWPHLMASGVPPPNSHHLVPPPHRRHQDLRVRLKWRTANNAPSHLRRGKDPCNWTPGSSNTCASLRPAAARLQLPLCSCHPKRRTVTLALRHAVCHTLEKGCDKARRVTRHLCYDRPVDGKMETAGSDARPQLEEAFLYDPGRSLGTRAGLRARFCSDATSLRTAR